MAKNPAGQMPCLELDDGTVLAEITVLCEYLDEISPGTSLIGNTAEARAECRMWTRRIDLNIVEPLAAGFRFAEGLKLFSSRIHVIPHAADDFKKIAQDKLSWLNGLMAGRTFVCGERLTLADVLLYCFLDFGANVGQPINPANEWIVAHHAMMGARPAAKA
jgi:glutathione S-transferase